MPLVWVVVVVVVVVVVMAVARIACALLLAVALIDVKSYCFVHEPGKRHLSLYRDIPI